VSSGAKTYDAVKFNVLAAIVKGFDPEWDVLVGAAYEGFIADMQDDLKIEIEILDDDEEMSIQPYLLGDDLNSETFDLMEPLLLSDLLLRTISRYGKDNALRALNDTLTAFYAKLEEQGLTGTLDQVMHEGAN
jgi:hypothetical protein